MPGIVGYGAFIPRNRIKSEEIARRGVENIHVDYEVLEPLTEMAAAARSPVRIHESGNLLKETIFAATRELDRDVSLVGWLRDGETMLLAGFDRTRGSLWLHGPTTRDSKISNR